MQNLWSCLSTTSCLLLFGAKIRIFTWPEAPEDKKKTPVSVSSPLKGSKAPTLLSRFSGQGLGMINTKLLNNWRHKGVTQLSSGNCQINWFESYSFQIELQFDSLSKARRPRCSYGFVVIPAFCGCQEMCVVAGEPRGTVSGTYHPHTQMQISLREKELGPCHPDTVYTSWSAVGGLRSKREKSSTGFQKSCSYFFFFFF